MPDWQNDVIWWNVYPLGFTGAPMRPSEAAGPDQGKELVHRLPRIEHWLDYLIELGCNGLSLGPIFDSVSHGYDTLDYYRIDPRLGDDADFDHLVSACHERGIKVLLDGVFNHVSAQYPDLVKALTEGPQSPTAELFRIDYTQNPPVRLNFEGSDDLVLLNHASPKVAELVTDVMKYWIRRGVEGWRLDAAYAIDPSFWAPVLSAVRDEFPQTFIYGEVIHGDYNQIAQASGMDSVTQYELWKACWSSLESTNFYELSWCLERHNGFLENFVPLTFLSNHDVTRIASQVGNEKAVLAAVLLGTLGGIPSIYYGDEQGYHGVKYDRFGGDDEVRPPMPDTPAELSGLGAPMLRAYQQIIGVRRRHSWLATARTEVTQLSNPSISYTVTDPDDSSHQLQVQLNLEPTPSARITDSTGTLYSYPD